MEEGHETAGTAAVLADEFKRFHEFEVRELDPLSDQKALIAIVPDGKRVSDLSDILEKQLNKPKRRRGTAMFHDVASFIAHIDRFKGNATAIFADQSNKAQPRLTSVIDYHPTGEDAKNTDWLQHRGVYAPALSEEWKAWADKNGKPMGQDDFAAFLEDRISDVVVPDTAGKLADYAALVQGRFALPSELIELSRGLSVNVGVSVKNAVTLASGEISVNYDEVHRDGAGQPIKVPNLFQIAIPVFYAGETYRLAARLRYRINGPALSWSYQLHRPDLSFDDAFNGIVEKVKTGTQRPVFLGSPEA